MHFTIHHCCSPYYIHTGPSDFDPLQPIRVEIDINSEPIDIRLFATNDEITLEYNDTVILRFLPQIDDLIEAVESFGEYVRVTSIVTIIDNDRKQLIRLNCTFGT